MNYQPSIKDFAGMIMDGMLALDNALKVTQQVISQADQQIIRQFTSQLKGDKVFDTTEITDYAANLAAKVVDSLSQDDATTLRAGPMPLLTESIQWEILVAWGYDAYIARTIR